jgi:cysteinyl-tRNA synthetase
LLAEFDEYMNDDFNTAKVLASMFELVPVINSIKDKLISAEALQKETFEMFKKKMKVFVEDVFGLRSELEEDYEKLDGVLQVLINLRKSAKAKKDYATSDAIRNQLMDLGIALKDEKNGEITYSFV